MPYNNQRSRPRYNKTKSSHAEKDAPPVVTEESSETVKVFLLYQRELDDKHDRYERLVKISRDITIESKRAIFILQRVSGETEKDQKSLQEAQGKFDQILKDKFYKIAVELMGQDPYQYVRAYSPGIQEYIEADSDPVAIEVFLSPVDYILGIADLTGELMRVAVNSVGRGDFQKPFEICIFLQKILGAFIAFGNIHRELPRKMNVLKASLGKVENVCYTIQIRGSEFPKHILAEMLKTADKDPTDFNDDIGFCGD